MNLLPLTDEETALVNAEIAKLESAINADLPYAEIANLYSDFLTLIDTIM